MYTKKMNKTYFSFIMIYCHWLAPAWFKHRLPVGLIIGLLFGVCHEPSSIYVFCYNLHCFCSGTLLRAEHLRCSLNNKCLYLACRLGTTFFSISRSDIDILASKGQLFRTDPRYFHYVFIVGTLCCLFVFPFDAVDNLV